MLMTLLHIVFRYEELEAISVSEKLNQLDMSENKQCPCDDEDDTSDVTSADSQAASSGDSDVKNENKSLGIHRRMLYSNHHRRHRHVFICTRQQ